MIVPELLMDEIAQKIKDRLNGRKIVMRWKDGFIEPYLKDHHNLEAAMYVTVARSKIDDVSTFSDRILDGNSDKYLLLMMPPLRWNKADDDKYLKMGFKNEEDIIWFFPGEKRVTVKELPFSYEDDCGNKISSLSKVSFVLKGFNSVIEVGKNVRLPSQPIEIDNNVKIKIGDNVSITSPRFSIRSGCSFTVGNDAEIRSHIVINPLSQVEIGEKSTVNTGQLRTGRNQKVIIGKDCMFSWDVVIVPHDGHLIWDVNTGKPLNNTTGAIRESVVIGDHVWIGGEVVFLPNSRVGSGSIIGYRSLVKGTFPNNCIIAGSPAKIIKKDVAWNRSNYSTSDDDFYNIEPDFRKKTT